MAVSPTSSQQSFPDPMGEHWGLLGVTVLPRGGRNLQRQLKKSLLYLFAAQCVKMQNFPGLRKTFLLCFVFSGKVPSGSPGFSCASHTCQLCRQGPINVHKTFWSLFIAATLPAAKNFSRLQSTRGRGALQQRSVLRAPLASQSLNPSKHSNNSPCKSCRK